MFTFTFLYVESCSTLYNVFTFTFLYYLQYVVHSVYIYLLFSWWFSISYIVFTFTFLYWWVMQYLTGCLYLPFCIECHAVHRTRCLIFTILYSWSCSTSYTVFTFTFLYSGSCSTSYNVSAFMFLYSVLIRSILNKKYLTRKRKVYESTLTIKIGNTPLN